MLWATQVAECPGRISTGSAGDAWLGEGGDFLPLMRPASDDVLRMWPVSRDINNVRNNRPKLLVALPDPGPETATEAKLDLNPA